jgi:hypothetical protein
MRSTCARTSGDASGALATFDGVSVPPGTSTFARICGLERDGLIARHVTPTVPPRVDYELTALGRDVLVPLDALAQWALDRRAAIHVARHEFDARQNR